MSLPPSGSSTDSSLPQASLALEQKFPYSVSDDQSESSKSPENFFLPSMTLQKIQVRKKSLTTPMKANLSKLELLALAIDEIINTYKREHQSQIDEVEQGDRFPKRVGSFHLKIYCWTTRSVKPMTTFLRAIGAKDTLLAEKVHNYCLFFFFRLAGPTKDLGEIFVATTDHAWQVVRPYVDYSFPAAVAKRVLSPSLQGTTSKHLSGGLDTSIDYFRVMHIVYDLDATYSLISSFSTAFKIQSSAQALAPFLTEQGKVSKKRFGVRVGSGSLKILKSLTLCQLSIVLAHFSKIVRGEKTHIENKKKNGVERDDPNFRFLDYIQPVFGATAKKLDELLQQSVWDLAQKRTCESTLWLCHRFSIDYFRALSVKLYTGKGKQKPEHQWDGSLPLITDVVNVVRSLSQTKEQKSFFKVLNTCQMAFPRRHRIVREPVIQFIEGEIWTKDGTYFKVQGVWRRVSSDFNELVDRDFHRLLDRSLLIEGSKDHQQHGLLTPWVRDKKWVRFSMPEFCGVTKLSRKDAQIKLMELRKRTYSFVNNDTSVQQNFLFGPILKRIDAKYHESIDQLLEDEESLTLAALQARLSVGIKKATEIYALLQGNWDCIAEETDESARTYRVWLTPSIPKRVKECQKLGEFLAQKEYVADTSPICDEGRYNESYLGKDGYILGDRICPSGIELWDILKYDGQNLTFYHVKESFGQKTRDACSQIVIAAKAINSALKNLRKTNNILHEFWNKAMLYDSRGKDTGYRALVKQDLLNLAPKRTQKKKVEKVARAVFLSLFSKKKRLTFVYAFLDTASKERVLEHEYAREYFSEELLVQSSLGLSEEQAKGVYETLRQQGYLSHDGYVTEKFLRLKRGFPKSLKLSEKKSLYKFMSERVRRSQFRTTLAKIELLRTAKELEQYGFQFKVFQIRRPPGARGDFSNQAVAYTAMPLAPSQQDFISSLLLRRTWEVKGNKYLQRSTRGRGSCAIHAFFGEWDEDTNQYCYEPTSENPDQAGKQFFSQKVEESCNDPNIRKIIYYSFSEMLQRISRNQELDNCQLMFPKGNIREQALAKHTELSNELMVLDQQESDLWGSILGEANEENGLGASLQEVVITNSQIGADLISQPADLQAALTQQSSEAFEPINAAITDVSKETWISILKAKTERRRLISEFVEEYLLRYLAILKDKDYWYLDFELEMMAHMQNHTLYLYKETEREVPHIYNPRATPDDPIVIIQTGQANGSQHYERCDLIEPL